MVDDKVAFSELPLFNTLIKDYLNGQSNLEHFPEYPTLDSFSVIDKPFNTREILHSRLMEQNKGLDLGRKTLENIESIKNNNTYTITTGHQLCLLTGPVYFINKICSVIALTNQLNSTNSDKHFVPVFWLASEDHDFEEVNHFHLFGDTYLWKNELKGAVGRMATNGIKEMLSNISEEKNLSDLAEKFMDIAANAYQEQTLTAATRVLINALFKDTGLVIIDGDDSTLKRAMIPYFEQELLKNTSYKSVLKTNEKLAAQEYKIQVNPREVNLFYLTDQFRERIIEENGEFRINNTSLMFSKDEILEELFSFPERFSPNVILRPLYQEVVLPNTAYVGGGGEISYWLQLTDLFKAFQVEFPILLVRDSAAFIRKKSESIKDDNKLSWPDFFLEENKLAKRLALEDVHIDFDYYMYQLKSMYDQLNGELDPGLQGMLGAEKTKALKGVENLEKRTIKNSKTKHEVKINRVIKVQKEIFPSGSLQERYLNYLELLATFDTAIIPLMIRTMNPLEKKFHFYIEN